MAEWTDEHTEEFWKLVAKSTTNVCWEWLGEHFNGEASFQFDGKPVGAQRIVYWLASGYYNNSLGVYPSCGNKNCCNPRHLWYGTNLDVPDITRLTEDDACDIRAKCEAGVSRKELADEYKVVPLHISTITGKDC